MRDRIDWQNTPNSFPSDTPPIKLDFGVLRPWRRSDIEVYHSLFCDADMMQWHDMPIPKREESLKRLAYAAETHVYRSQWSYAIHSEMHGVVGHLDLRLLSASNRSLEVSFGLRAAVRRRGLMSSILSTVIRYWAEHFQVASFYARVKRHNRASNRLMLSCKFEVCHEASIASLLHETSDDHTIFYRDASGSP